MEICHYTHMLGPAEDNRAAIISAKANEPLLSAARDEPSEAVDSGWQFSSHYLGGGFSEDVQIWSVEEVLKREPSLRKFIDLPTGVKLRRESSGDEWHVTRASAKS